MLIFHFGSACWAHVHITQFLLSTPSVRPSVAPVSIGRLVLVFSLGVMAGPFPVGAESEKTEPTSDPHFLTSSLDATRDTAAIDRMRDTRPLIGGAPLEPKVFDLFAPVGPLRDAPGDPLFPDPFEMPFRPVRNCGHYLHEHLGLLFTFHNATIYQWASEALPGNRADGGANRILGRLDAKLWEPEGVGVGKFVVQFRHFEDFGPPSDMGGRVGSDVSLDYLWGKPGMTKLYYLRLEQGLLDDRVRLVVGKINPNNYIMNNPMAGDEETQFVGAPFDGCDAIPPGFQGYMPGVAALITPMSGLYANLVATSPLGAQARGPGFDTIGDGLWWFGTEVGVVTAFLGEDRPGRCGLGVSTTNCGLATTDAGSSVTGNGLTLIITQNLTPDFGIWLQYGATDQVMATPFNELAAGLSLEKPFGRKGDGCGLAFARSEPADDSLPTQILLESYYRVQVTQSLDISPNVQVVMDASSPAGDDRTVVIGGIRALLKF